MDLSERVRSMTDDELVRVTAKLEAEGGSWHDEPERAALVLLLRNERERRGRDDGTPRD